MKTAELTGALLDYWVARAEGESVDQISVKDTGRKGGPICVKTTSHCQIQLGYSTDWTRGGPLIEKWRSHPMMEGLNYNLIFLCNDPLQAICRAVVRAAFGDEVEEVPAC